MVKEGIHLGEKQELKTIYTYVHIPEMLVPLDRYSTSQYHYLDKRIMPKCNDERINLEEKQEFLNITYVHLPEIQSPWTRPRPFRTILWIRYNYISAK